MRPAAAGHGHFEEEHEEENSERWLLTYSDMITLLLALFVILFAISSINHAKYAELKSDLHNTFNGSAHATAVRAKASKATSTAESASEAKAASRTKASSSSAQSSSAKSATVSSNSLRTIEAQLRQALSSAGLLGDVEISATDHHLTLGFVAAKTFYSLDSAQLSPVGANIVDVAGGVLRQHPNTVEVDGYTDNQPISGGPYRDNWELSAERAVVVVEQLQDGGGVNPVQLSAVGLGQYHPLVPNTSPAGQAENRRVNIVVSPAPSATKSPSASGTKH